MIKQFIVGNMYRWKPTGEKIIFKQDLRLYSAYLFIEKESGIPLYLYYNELMHVESIGSAKLIKMDKRIV